MTWGQNFTQDAQRMNEQVCQIWRRCAPPFFCYLRKTDGGCVRGLNKVCPIAICFGCRHIESVACVSWLRHGARFCVLFLSFSISLPSPSASPLSPSPSPSFAPSSSPLLHLPRGSVRPSLVTQGVSCRRHSNLFRRTSGTCRVLSQTCRRRPDVFSLGRQPLVHSAGNLSAPRTAPLGPRCPPAFVVV